jgi:hypothetical protein
LKKEPAGKSEVIGGTGISQWLIPDSKPYQIAGYIIRGDEWRCVQREGDHFLLLSGYASINLNYDLLWFGYPRHILPFQYRDGEDDFDKKRTVLPRWNRTRWLVTEYIKDGPVTLHLYDFKAGKPVSATSRGIKKIDRLIESGKLKLVWDSGD